MLNKIFVKNFQSIEGEHELEIKPITILVGPNSSGKSAILDLMHWFSYIFRALYCSQHIEIPYDLLKLTDAYKKNHRFGSDISRVGVEHIISSKDIRRHHNDLGRIKKYFFKETNDEEGYPLKVNTIKGKENHSIKFIFEFEQLINDAWIDKDNLPDKMLDVVEPGFKSFQLEINDNIILFYGNREVLVNLDNYPFLSKAQKKKIITQDGIFNKRLTTQQNSSLAKFLTRKLNFSTKDLKKPFFDIIDDILNLTNTFRGLDIVPASRKILTPEESIFFPDLNVFRIYPRKEPYISTEQILYKHHIPKLYENEEYSIFQKLAESIAFKKHHMEFIRFLEDQKIDYDFWDDDTDFDSWASQLIDNLNTTLLEEFLIDTGYQIDADVSFILNDNELYHYDNNSLDDYSVKNLKKNVSPIVRIYLRDAKGNKLEFQDIGSGFAYSIPVLIAASSSGNLSFIQQPELHIHPALQSRLGEIFVRSLKKNKRHLIETHSEHFILRLLKLIRIKKYENFNQDDLSVLYFQPNAIDNSTSIKSIRITEDGDFLDKWPNGFFEERYKDIFDE